MKYPAIFFFRKKRNAVKYFYAPTGNGTFTFDAYRYLRQLPAYKKTKLSVYESKKTLILSDWTAWKWHDKKITDIKAALNQLLADGFSIYQRQNDEFVSLTPNKIDELDDLSIRIKMRPDSDEDIINSAVNQLNLQKEKVHILNDYWLAMLLQKSSDPLPRQFDIAALILSPFNTESLFSFIKSIEKPSIFSPKLEKIINTEFSVTVIDNYNDNEKISQMPALPIVHDYKILSCSLSSLDQLFKQKFLTYKEHTITLENLKNIEFSCINSSNIDFHPCKDILTHMPSLEVLKLFGNSRVTVTLNWEDLKHIANQLHSLSIEDYYINQNNSPSFTALEKLALTRVKTNDSLLPFLKTTPFVISLKLDHLEQETKLSENPSVLKFLKKLYISNCKNNDDLQIILKNKFYLKHFTAKNCDLPDFMSKDNPFPELTNLTISLCNFTNENWEAFFSTVPKLQFLTLGSCQLNSLNQAVVLPELIKIELFNITFRMENLAALIQYSEKLVSLSLSSCKFQNEDIQILEDLSYIPMPPLPLPLGSLRNLILENVSITSDQLQFLLTSAHQLESLTIRNCNIDSLEIIFSFPIPKLILQGTPLLLQKKSHYLASLQSLSLSLNLYSFEPDYSQFELEYILDDAHYIRQLEVFGIDLANDRSFSLYLVHLKKLVLRHLSITANNFSNFLSNSFAITHLQLIDVKIWNELTGNFSFPLLHTIDLKGCSISTNNLIILIHASPNLKIFNASSLYGFDYHDPNLTALLEERGIEIEPPSQPVEHTNQDTITNPVQLIHRPDSNLNNLPPPDPEHFEFNYKGKNKTKNQDMITEKLSQYLTLTKHPKAQVFIPKIQSGICAVLTKVFDQLTKDNFDQWDDFIQTFQQWNGHHPISEELQQACRLVLKQYKKHELQKQSERIYLGDACIPWLSQQVNHQAIYIENPWHAVIKKHHHFYDPNNPVGHEKYEYTNNNINNNQITKSLGHLLFVKHENNIIYPAPVIDDPEAFIHDGGLLVLCSLKNEELIFILTILEKYFINNINIVNNNIEQGLLLRDMHGQPAWYLALNSGNKKIAQLVCELLIQYAAFTPNTFENTLSSSISHLSQYAQLNCIMSLRSHLNINSSKITDKICDAIIIKKDEVKFEKQFETWKQPKPVCLSPEDYYAHLTSHEKSKRLLHLNSSQEIENLSMALQYYCESKNQAVYYIHSPEEMICSAPYLKRKGQYGFIKKGPGGDFHRFLTKKYHPSQPAVLIINYDSFDSDDLIRLKLDDNKIDNTPLSENIIIIGLINPNKIDSNLKNSFYLSFGINNIEICPITPIINHSPIYNKTDDKQDVFTIDFFHGQNWKEHLLGRLKISNSLMFEKGVFTTALNDGRPIELKNGLWDDEDFCYFWRRLMYFKYIEHEGVCYKIFPETTFLKSEGYHWPQLKKQFHLSFYPPAKNTPVLNPTLLGNFFDNCEYDHQNKKPSMLPGLIETHKNKSLSICITRSLSEDEWGRLLSECKKHQVLLTCYCALGVTLPFSPTPDAELLIKNSPDQIIKSNDIDAALILNTQNQNEKWQIINISECHPNNLLTHIDETFKETKGALLQALDAKKSVVLIGTFSPELADSLAPLLLARDGVKNAGKILIISEDTQFFSYMRIHQQWITHQDKFNILSSLHPGRDIPADLYDYPLCQMSAQLAYAAFPFSPWQGLTGISGGIKLKKFDEIHSQQEAENFIHERRHFFFTLLATLPYIFLTGLTGVGKSTFIEQLASSDTKVLVGEDKLLDWAQDQSNGYIILFIDEANLLARDWSEFEGLFYSPRGIVINKTWYPLSDRHKVVFAGNPLNYGGDRTIPTLYKGHGGAFVFELMPQAFIYEKILKPLFINTILNSEVVNISKKILKVYEFLCCSCSQDKVLISPRELQMMALLVLSHAQSEISFGKKISSAQIMDITEFYVYTLSKNLVPEKYQPVFEQEFKPKKIIQKVSQSTLTPTPFLLTASREPIYQHLSHLLTLRELRREQKNTLNDSQLYGGLGGLILKGEPDIGKNKLIFFCLKNHGYQEVTLNTPTKAVPDKAFYLMPNNMPPDDRTRLLKKAFDEGALVLIKNIDSTPHEERLLNDLLMGKLFETGRENWRPDNPGFSIIGTESPSEIGLYPPSNALERRITTISVLPYPTKELIAIVETKGIKLETAKLMVSVYEKKLALAQKQSLKPAPNMQTLMDVAEEYMKSHRDAELTIIKQEPSLLIHSLFAKQSKLEAINHTTIDLVKSYPPAGFPS
jgi:hypothetical protein